MSAALAIARLLDALEALEQVARNLHPPDLDTLVAGLADREAALAEAQASAAWPEPLRQRLDEAAQAALRGCRELREVGRGAEHRRPAAATSATAAR